jgi:hypothetical protein
MKKKAGNEELLHAMPRAYPHLNCLPLPADSLSWMPFTVLGPSLAFLLGFVN